MGEVSVIGLDLAKNVFQLHGVDAHGKVVLRRRLRRAQVEEFFATLPPCLVGMESCPGAHHWARVLQRLGHRARIMPADYVRPYRKGGKNDASDAEAICEAVQRPGMRFVAVKTAEQQGVLALHRARALLVRQEVALVNAMRAVLAEHGVVLGRGRREAVRAVAHLLEEGEGAEALPESVRVALAALLEAHRQLEARVRALDAALRTWHRGCEASRRLATIPGIGVLTATALVATVGEGGAHFRSGRHLAAWLGLVPRQHSSGERQRLGRISKRGNGYLRRLLVLGAQALLRHVRRHMAAGRPSALPWAERLLRRRPPNVVAVALANKLARQAWAVLHHGEPWRAQTA